MNQIQHLSKRNKAIYGFHLNKNSPDFFKSLEYRVKPDVFKIMPRNKLNTCKLKIPKPSLRFGFRRYFLFPTLKNRVLEITQETVICYQKDCNKSGNTYIIYIPFPSLLGEGQGGVVKDYCVIPGRMNLQAQNPQTFATLRFQEVFFNSNFKEQGLRNYVGKCYLLSERLQ